VFIDHTNSSSTTGQQSQFFPADSLNTVFFCPA